jgi:hypothetical protein
MLIFLVVVLRGMFWYALVMSEGLYRGLE